MQVKIEKTFQVNQPIEKVWEILSNPTKVVTCVPGAEITEAIDEKTFKGVTTMKIGPVTTKYNGEIRLELLDEANYKLEIVGKGLDTKGKGSASMKMTGQLRKLDDGGTEVASSMEVSVIGRLAQFGSRMMVDVSNQIFEQFTENFKQALQSPEGSEVKERISEPIKAVPLFFSTLWAAIVRFFRHIIRPSTKT